MPRTPFWGPLSGATATVGGSLSQSAILWGSARYGVSAESVLAREAIKRAVDPQGVVNPGSLGID